MSQQTLQLWSRIKKVKVSRSAGPSSLFSGRWWETLHRNLPAELHESPPQTKMTTHCCLSHEPVGLFIPLHLNCVWFSCYLSNRCTSASSCIALESMLVTTMISAKLFSKAAYRKSLMVNKTILNPMAVCEIREISFFSRRLHPMRWLTLNAYLTGRHCGAPKHNLLFEWNGMLGIRDLTQCLYHRR